MTQRYIGGLIYNPPGGYSGYFNGSSSLSISSSNTVLPTGTQDFCVEMWFSWQTQSGSYPQLIANPTTNGFQIYYDVASGLFAVGIFNVSNVITYTISQTALSGGWNHLAVTRSGNTFRLFLNGILQANGTNTISFASVTTQYIGSDGSRPYTGYLSNVRTVLGAIPTPYQTSSTTNGTAVFTPPNGALQAITSTALLTCAFATFRDGSTNNYTITVNSATVSTQNPFPLTTLPNPAQGNAGNGIFSMSQYQSLLSQNLWPALDPYFENVTLLLHGNGTNGAQNNTFLDSGTANSGSGFTITRNGDTTQGTFSPFSLPAGTWSNYFPGSSSIQMSSSSSFNINTYDTLECWVNLSVLGTNNLFLGREANYWLGYNHTSIGGTANKFVFSIYNGSSWQAVSSSTSPSAGVWYHILGVKDNTTLRIYINGVQENTATFSGSPSNSSYNVFVGANNTSESTTGYVSNARLITGASNTVFPYSGLTTGASFTVPTSSLTNVSGTAFLTCQSNRFVDNGTANSGSGFTVSVNGTSSVQAFSPFNPTAAYSAATVGGSGYFDGTGDYLTAPDNAVFDFGTSAFTIECWVYFNNISGDQYVLSYDTGTTPDQNGINIYSGGWRIGGFNSYLITGSTGLIAQQWIHVAMTRDSNTLRAYINGVQLGTSDVTGVTFDATGAIHIGSIFNPAGSFTLNGYLSGLRITKGGCLYPNGTTFTVPTSPPTTTVSAGTVSLLLNFTNAGIIDSTAKNDLVTVGGAQVSTTQSKFGGASLYFDGNGDTLPAPDSPNCAFGTGSFTIEFWAYSVDTGSLSSGILDTRSSSGSGTGLFIAPDGTANYRIGYGLSPYTLLSVSGRINNQWQHVAFVRNGSTLMIFIDGVLRGSTSNSTNFSDQKLRISGFVDTQASPYAFNGYLDDIRITKGIARYTSNFTPQTSQWQDQ